MTKRVQKNHIMSKEEKEGFVEIIRRLPWLYAPMLKALRPYTKTSKTLVDIGCGDGFLLSLIHKQFPRLDLRGIDVDSFMIHEAKKFPFRFNKKSVEDFSGAADIIISNLALHHFKYSKRIIKKLYALAQNALIIADQIRPATVSDLEKRLQKRKKIIGAKDVEYYRASEEKSIREAYSKKEIIEMFNDLNVKYAIFFSDKDYYERFVAVFEK